MLFRRDLTIEKRIFRGIKYQLLALGRDEIKNFVANVPYLVISITDPDKAEAEIAESSNLVGIIRLKFHDVGKPNKLNLGNSSDIAMSAEQAQQILSFVRSNISGAKLIVCQCEQGVSRSAAIVASLSRILQGEDEYFFKHYWLNRWVYDLLLETARK